VTGQAGAVTRRRGRRRRLLRWACLLIGVIVVTLVFEEVAFRIFIPNQYSQGRNGIWLSHTWLCTPHKDSEYRALAGRLSEMRITDVYVHAYPLRADGGLDRDRVAYAADLARDLKRMSPNLRLYAWLGHVPLEGGVRPDLSSTKVREAIVRTAGRLLDKGFRGIQYDFEPIRSGDSAFLSLLRESRTELKRRSALLSVAAPHPDPFQGLGSVIAAVSSGTSYWSDRYFRKVAGESDQVAVMCYDSGIPLPGLYGRMIARTTRWALANGAKELMIGVPTYGRAGRAHMLWVENLGNALAGLKYGVASLKGEQRAKVGAAVFAEWTTSKSERELFRSEWLRHARK